MELPNNMPEELKDILRRVLGDDTDDKKDWVQVGRLDGPDILRRKTYNKKADVMQRQLTILAMRVKHIHAKSDVMAAQWWDSLHKKYSLPQEGNFTITDDNRILMKPTNGEK